MAKGPPQVVKIEHTDEGADEQGCQEDAAQESLTQIELEMPADDQDGPWADAMLQPMDPVPAEYHLGLDPVLEFSEVRSKCCVPCIV